MKRKSIEILALATTFFIVLFSNIIFSNSNPFTNGKTCSDVFGNCDNATINDAFPPCNGTQSHSDAGRARIKEVYINASSFFYDDEINVTCTFRLRDVNNTMQVWYNDSSNWYLIINWNNGTATDDNGQNYSTVFKINSTEGTHIVRCMINYCGGGVCPITGHCVNSTDGGNNWDNDDVNFTVTTHLTYNFWSLTNYTNGSEIASGGTYNRNTLLNASAHWTKNISFAQVEHNGTGSWVNYTICSFPNCIGNWTNYTLNLSNSSEFNNTIIAIRSIYANDTYSATNNTSPILYFNLSAGNLPNVTNFWFSYSGVTTNITNMYTNLTIYANVSDDVGLSTLIANITYPDGNSTNTTMTGETSSSNQWKTWNYTFGNDNKLNQTGNYTIRIVARDIGGNEKRSGIDCPVENMTFTVYNNYTLNLTSNYTIFNRGENITPQVWDVNDFQVYNLNWTANLTRFNQTTNTTSYTNSYTYTIAKDDPEGNYTLFANASKNNNTGNYSWNFSVSKNLSLAISTNPSSTPPRSSTVTVSASLYNARGELYNLSINANISCDSGVTWSSLNFTSGQASYSCIAPSGYSAPFNIDINATDSYNNTGENYTTLTTEAQQVVYTSSGGGSSGGFATPKKETIKNCTDGTQYSQCSVKRPYYCSNGTLIRKCSICGCDNSDYGCQPDGYCALIREEDFNFNLSAARLEIKQGGDKEITGVLKNTGNTVLELMSFYNASEYCCNISMPPSFELKEKEEKVFTISIHAPLFAVVGEYPNTTISIGTNLFRKDKTIDIIVGQSQHYSSLSELENQLADIENKIQEVKKTGIDTTNLEAMVEKSRALLQNANSSIAGDQIDVLSASLANLTSNNQLVESRLGGLRNQAFLLQNAWLIGLFVVMSFTTMYMVPQVLLPLNKKEKELSELKEEEETLVLSRVETEKQYFMRKIDENTFSKIMIGKQDRILKLRVQIREKENERNQLIKAVSPLAMATWFANGIKGIPKKIKNSPKSILNRKNKNNIDNDGKTQ